MTYDEWEAAVPADIRADSLWRVEAYRLSLFLCDLAFEDSQYLVADPRTRSIADQLVRAVGRISANVAEGSSRATGKSRALYYDYALGYTREARDWYYKSRHVLPSQVPAHRLGLASSIIRLVLTMACQERRTNRKITVRKGRAEI